MKPFNLAQIVAGAPPVMRAGGSVRFIAHVPEAAHVDTRLIWFDVLDKEVFTTNELGEYIPGTPSLRDVFLAPVKLEMWANVYADNNGAPRGYLHDSKRFADEAFDNAHDSRIGDKAHRVEIEL